MPPSATLLDHPHLWRRSAPRTLAPGLATGHAALDAALPGGGLPAQALTEVLLPDPGHGEWTLLLPLLARLQRPIALVAPPLLPYPPALLRHGIDARRLLLVAARCERETLWSAEQCLRSGACDAVLAWLGAHPWLRPGPSPSPVGRGVGVRVRPESSDPANPGARSQSLYRRQRGTDPLDPAQALRRLQLACEAGRTPGIVFRDPDCARQASPAALRLGLRAGAVEVIKCRGGHPGARVAFAAG